MDAMVFLFVQIRNATDLFFHLTINFSRSSANLLQSSARVMDYGSGAWVTD